MDVRKSLGAVIVFLIVFLLYFVVFVYFFPMLLADGRFQDIFAGIAALFSGLAFLGVVYAILLQKEELSLQRKELELTRSELKRTAEAQEKSERALAKQAESLKITAKLNGKSAALQHINTLIEITNSSRYGVDEQKFNKYKQQADLIIDEINKLVEGK